MFGLAALCFLLLQTGVSGFGLSSGESLSHQEITKRAILNTTAQTCRALALAEGKDFTFPSLTVDAVAAACEAPSKSFLQTIQLIQSKNKQVDLTLFSKAQYHMDNEQILEGRKIITDGLAAVKASNREQNFEAAREKLGQILHPLQDFYSHSNWVEMGNKLPNSNLIRSDTSVGNIAAESRATCRNCNGDDCTNNILEDILREMIITSGYFNFVPFSSSKPKGKCSHGGFLDRTSNIEPIGGINKDTLDSSHGHLHMDAANVAIAATSELLEDIRGAAGDKPFLQMMGISRGSSKALCFVIDTTGSMSDDIAAVRTVTSDIIDRKVGTQDEPSLYILVPFNDPDFGPLTRTTDPEVFRNAINSLTATGGGDFPEMSLSGLQLALTGAPPSSEIFLFTDAAAKDAHLRSTVLALIEQTKTVVNFMITAVLGFRRRRQSDDSLQQQQQQQQQQPLSRMVRSDAQLYRDLAQASGGLAIEVSKSELLEATSIITQTSSSSLVTLLQAARNPGKAENFTFTVDESVKNLTVYITGNSVTFTLISPSGVSQESTNTTGSLITASQSVGNFKTLQLKQQVGLWEIQMVSTNPYILKVVGESPVDFLFNFLEESQGPFGGFDVVDNRPRAGVNGSLMVTVTGSESATVTEVILVESSGSGEVNGNVEAQGGGDFLAHFDRIPAEEFVVLVKGQSNNGSSRMSSTNFQRQSPTNIRASAVAVTSPDSESVLVPGTSLSVPFTVMTSGAGGTFSIQATNDQSFPSTFPSSLMLETEGSANGTVNLTAPLNTASGTVVTLTISAEASGGADTNYVVRRFTVLETVTDITKPVCVLLSLLSICSDNCMLSMWELSVQVTDGANGTGVDHITLRQGNGTLNTSLAADNEDITLVSYIASCCSPDVELVVVDRTGASGFGLSNGESLSHQEITKRAILNTTAQTCRALALAEGKDFTFPSLTVDAVAAACEASKSSKSFLQTIQLIQSRNKRVDYFLFFLARYHMDNEQILEGRKIITDGLATVKASNKEQNFEAAREKLGQILHPLQDFYSHSNWVEMGNKLPNSNLIRSDTSVGNIAAESRATCRNCNGDDCRNNILEDILQEMIITSGYFNFVPFSSSKPKGKCSHGGFLDRTSNIKPIGGINKDTLDSSHGHLHMEAANVAIAATSELLEDIRGAAGDKPFLQMMGISRGSGKPLCFMIDTTGSMRDDIVAVRTVTSDIINRKVGTQDEPSVYILVPFNDPGKKVKVKLPYDRCPRFLIQLALTGAPPSSELFLFTDAAAKDAHLRNTVLALIEQTKTVVNFMITGNLGFRRRRQSDDSLQQEQQQQQPISRMARSDAQLYRDLAQASGGLAIEVSKSELLEGTGIITQTSSSSLVTLLQAARNPGKAENFTFTIDESVKNLTVYITGNSVTFTLISPSGVSQESSNTTGSLITASQSVGNFKTLQLKQQVGLWEIQMVSTNPYILKVVGESPVDFLFNFLEESQGPFGGFDVIDNRPRAGVNGSLMVTVTGSESATVTEVILVESSGSGEVNGTVEAQGGGDFLAHFDRIPAEEFVVLVKGQSNNGSSRMSSANFQRQSPTNIRASAVTVTSPDSDSILVPGTPLSVPFTVMMSGAGRTFSIQATNDQSFPSTFPSSLMLDSEGSANGTVTLTAPLNTASGTVVTLTISAEASGGADTNYVVRRFTVLETVTDITKPVCVLLSLQSICSDNCMLSMWELSVQVTDGANGTGVDHITLRQGNGTLNTSLAADNEDITLVSYIASCCSPDVELVVVDRVGNVATCFYSVRKTAATSSQAVTVAPATVAAVESLSNRAAQSFLLCLSIMVLGLSLTF
ncbi:hypothetical protein ABVT39_011242 [Epinephelus coioides]